MKKRLVFLFTALMCISLFACGNEVEKQDEMNNKENNEANNEINNQESKDKKEQDAENQGNVGQTDDLKDDEEDNENISDFPVLMRIGRFTGLEVLESNNDYNGGYLYRDLTEDTLTVITNCCFVTCQEEGESLEDYMRWTAHEIGGEKPQEFCWEENAEHSQRLTYPVYILSWQTGANEDSRGWDGFFFMTDTHTYLYAFDTAIDYQADMQSVWFDVFGELTLVAD